MYKWHNAKIEPKYQNTHKKTLRLLRTTFLKIRHNVVVLCHTYLEISTGSRTRSHKTARNKIKKVDGNMEEWKLYALWQNTETDPEIQGVTYIVTVCVCVCGLTENCALFCIISSDTLKVSEKQQQNNTGGNVWGGNLRFNNIVWNPIRLMGIWKYLC